MKVQAILLCGGVGNRMKSDIPKTLLSLRGKPLFVYSCEAIEQSREIEGIVLVVPKGLESEFQAVLERFSFQKTIQIISGGEERFLSVQKALKVLEDEVEFVLIHDGARPFLTAQFVDECVRLCYNERAVISAVPAKATIKEVGADLHVKKTLDRSLLWEVQTPQVFDKDLLLEAHVETSCENPTDDAMLVEMLGKPVKVLEGSYRNIKVTTPEDMVLADCFLSDKS